MQSEHPLRQVIQVIRSFIQELSGNKTQEETLPPPPPPPPLPEDDLPRGDEHATFPPEMFARLLMALPEERRNLAEAYNADDMPLLKFRVHHLLGGACYCNAPDLTASLRELRLALKTEEPQTIRYYYQQTIDIIDTTLVYSGYRE